MDFKYEVLDLKKLDPKLLGDDPELLLVFHTMRDIHDAKLGESLCSSLNYLSRCLDGKGLTDEVKETLIATIDYVNKSKNVEVDDIVDMLYKLDDGEVKDTVLTAEVNKALEMLKNQKTKNLSMIYTLEKNLESVTDIKIINDSVMIWKKTDAEWVMIDTENYGDIDLIMSELKPKDKKFNCIRKDLSDIILKKVLSNVDWMETTYRFYLPDNVSLPKIDESEIIELKEEDAQIVDDYWEYKDENSLKYVKEMIVKNPSVGIKKDGKLIAWVSIHEDIAMGFAYVIDEYRGKGYAKTLTTHICNILRSKNIIPFLYVVTDNTKSVGLSKSLGFVNDGQFRWFSYI